MMTIDYLTLENDFDKAECDFTPAFAQGLLSAYCCTGNASNDWVLVLFSEPDAMNVTQRGCIEKLNQLKQQINEQLTDSDLPFQLLLDASPTLADQALSTREWASGFWLGMQRCGLKTADETALEFLKDLSAIAAMPIPEEEDEQTQIDLIDIQEYCRLGVINLCLT